MSSAAATAETRSHPLAYISSTPEIPNRDGRDTPKKPSKTVFSRERRSNQSLGTACQSVTNFLLHAQNCFSISCFKSAPCKKVFLASQYIQSYTRNQMSLETLESLVCLKDWAKNQVFHVTSISPQD
ncbi:uncharacterized protein VP01_626g7 [Puccinia sorghi]|uniref:HAT C-terminal dimerisation domain-containing protein n=1 Tax=Puccinia sorghi TaxID=27349 RepID=A0A0L6UGF7_9BASI|nr:uncharacterized protein VP01_626g7 [Puccinia sorghi]